MAERSLTFFMTLEYWRPYFMEPAETGNARGISSLSPPGSWLVWRWAAYFREPADQSVGRLLKMPFERL